MPDDPGRAGNADPHETTARYRPPTTPEANEWWAPATRFAAALFLTAAACRTAGLDGLATAIITASSLVAFPPMAALGATALRVIAMVAGAALGIAGALWGLAARVGVPSAFHLVLGAVIGLLASRDATLIYTAAIPAVVVSTGAEDIRPLGTIMLGTCSHLIICTVIALRVVCAYYRLSQLLSVPPIVLINRALSLSASVSLPEQFSALQCHRRTVQRAAGGECRSPQIGSAPCQSGLVGTVSFKRQLGSLSEDDFIRAFQTTRPIITGNDELLTHLGCRSENVGDEGASLTMTLEATSLKCPSPSHRFPGKKEQMARVRLSASL